MGNEAVNRFLEMMSAERGASANTLEAYGRDVGEFLTYCGGLALKEISRDDVGDFVQYLGRVGRSPKTVARKLSAVREFFKFLYTEKDIKDNPAADVLTPKQEKPLPKFLSEDEIKRLIAAAKECSGPKGRQMTAMLELMYASGLRVSELVSLPENCINFDRRQVFVRGKGSKERVVPVAPAAIQAVFDYLEQRDCFIREGRRSIWLFPSKSSRSGHISRDTFFKRLKELAVKAGIYPSRVTPHVLRHSFATHLLNHNADLRSVQKMLGHESINTTEIYTHILSDKLLETVQKLHPLAGKHS
uniref:site-specific tyrosine recombinase/integron integrase n=1 Tax=Candidatus Scatocola faecipullorum TaxID=2840917 RepID=UPI004029160A